MWEVLSLLMELLIFVTYHRHSCDCYCLVLSMNEVYKQTILSGAGALQYPWEVTYGPDGNLWITESHGYKVYKMNPTTGAKTTTLDISFGSTSTELTTAEHTTFNVQFNH